MEPCAIRTSTSSFCSELSSRLTNTAGDTRLTETLDGLSHALLPATESTSGHIRGELLRLLCLLADKNPTRFCQALGDTLGEEVDVDAEVYCRRVSRRRSDDHASLVRRMRATLGLACAQAPTLCTQVVVFSVSVFFLLVLSVRWNSLEARRGEDSAAQLEALCA